MIEIVIEQRRRDLGGNFEVGRVLPFAKRRMVGPFIFFNHMGPLELAPGVDRSVDVRPHPHIGLATVSYLFAGEIMHRDSLGYTQAVRPHEVNWMTAGRGITHSERTGSALRRTGSRLFGLQSWVALSARDEETAPAFEHYDAAALPVVSAEGKTVRLIAGEAYGARSPVRTSSPMVYADVALEAGAVLPLDADYDERAIYTVSGAIEIAGDGFGPAQLLVFRPGDRISVRATENSRFMVLGGEPMDGPRHLWWNFVSSRPERIAQAKEDWRQGRFDTVPDDAEFIPLPEDPPPVRYP